MVWNTTIAFTTSFLLLFFHDTATTRASGSIDNKQDHSRRNNPFVLSQICNRNNHDDAEYYTSNNRKSSFAAIDYMEQLISMGYLSMARNIAYACLQHSVGNNSKVIPSWNRHNCCCCPYNTREEIVQAYALFTNTFFRTNDNFLDSIAKAYTQPDSVRMMHIQNDDDDALCWDGQIIMSPDNNENGLHSFTSIAASMESSTLTYNNNVNMSPGSAIIQRWNDCCSFFHTSPTKDEYSCYDTTNNNDNNKKDRRLCCEVSPTNDNHLILPALREPMVNINLPIFKGNTNDENNTRSETMYIEQEGSLRMFDVSGVLWPAGYLLGLCLSNPLSCGIPEVLDAMMLNGGRRQPIAIELGAGVGFPSLAFAKALRYHHMLNKASSDDAKVCDDESDNISMPIVVATDVSNSSVALIASNARINNVSGDVIPMRLNHTDISELLHLTQQFVNGFDMIIASSLQSLFDNTSRDDALLWQVLDALLSKDNDNAIIVLCHVKTGDERIQLPIESVFECIRRISGDHFRMKTRDGLNSDFELVVIRRRRKR
jgi:hypothetical protein